MKNRFQYLVIACLVLVTFAQNLAAQNKATQTKPADLGAFTKEIMAIDFSDGQTHLALWFPYEFFVEAALSESSMTRVVAEQELAFLKPYITIVVQSHFDQPDGTSVYAPENEIRARAALRLADGTNTLPLEKVPPRVSATMAAIKAVISSQANAGPANMHILVFPATTKKGERIVDTARKSSLTLFLKADTKFKEIFFT